MEKMRDHYESRRESILTRPYSSGENGEIRCTSPHSSLASIYSKD